MKTENRRLSFTASKVSDGAPKHDEETSQTDAEAALYWQDFL
jgi:hypothetical protein